MRKCYFLCNKKICISADYFPEDNDLWKKFESDDNGADISITCIKRDELSEPSGELVASSDGVSVYSKDSQLTRYENMGSDSGSSTVFTAGEVVCSKTEIVSRNYNVLMDSRYMWSTVSLGRLLLEKKALLFHASYIRYQGEGIIFSAPCGTGKSTQASLWEKYEGASVINGDKAGVSAEEDGVFVHGLPFCGTSNICHNVSSPLRAIVLLSQAKENTVEPVRGAKALQMLMDNIYLDYIAPDERAKCVDVLIDILGRVPVYHLSCTPDADAVSVLKKAVFG